MRNLEFTQKAGWVTRFRKKLMSFFHTREEKERKGKKKCR